MISAKPKNRFRTLLLNIFLISAAAHVVLLVLFGGYTVYRFVVSSGAQFDEPPPAVEEVPPPASVEVAIQRPRSSDLPQAEIRMQTVGNIAVAAIATDVPTMSESFVVADAGMSGLAGARLGGSGGLGLGMSEISVFSVRDRGERILFVVDAGRNMLLDSKGGLYSYNAIKEELIRIIGELSPGTLFNVILFEGARSQSRAFKPSMVAATPDNFDAISRWFMPINRSVDNLGLSGGSIQVRRVLEEDSVGRTFAANGADGHRWPPQPWVTHNALEQDADLIYVITANWGGFSNMVRHITESEREHIAREKARLEATTAFQRALSAHLEERARLLEVIKARETAEAAERRQRNLPPRVWIHATAEGRGGFYERINAYNISMQNRDPRPAEFFWPHESPIYRHQPRDIEEYFRNYLRVFYRQENKTVPRMNVILFLAEDEELSQNRSTEIRNFLRHFNNGRLRDLRGLAAIRSTTGRS